MEDIQFMLHMDRSYDWRCYLCDHRGQVLAVSNEGYFSLADASTELERLRLALKPANDN